MVRRPFPLQLATTASDEPTGCGAPTFLLHLAPTGAVSACCAAREPYGLVGRHRLAEIWSGPERATLMDRLSDGRFEQGCQACGRGIELEGRRGSLPAQYDEYLPGGQAHRPDAGLPRKIDFMLSNACNLQCVQCSGEFSSAIRIHREGRPALSDPYDDDFFDDLRTTLPTLEEASFEGGEPFLARANFRVFDMIAELNPGLPITICTNGTQWSPRVERVLRDLNVNLIVSLDGITKSGYESIRIGADLDRVLENFEKMAAIVRGRSGTVNVNHCLMRNNYEEFAPLLLWAEERSVAVHVSVVRWPTHLSVWHLDPEGRRRIARHLADLDPGMRRDLVLNLETWDRELHRLTTWANTDEDDLQHARMEPHVLDFPKRGAPRVDDHDAVAELRSMGAPDRVHAIRVDLQDKVTQVPASLEHLLGIDPGGLDGADIDQVGTIVSEVLGPFPEPELVVQGPDRVDRVLSGERHRIYVASVLIRDRRGRATAASVVLAVDPPHLVGAHLPR